MLATILICVSSFQLQAADTNKVTVRFEDASIRQIISYVEGHSGYRFFYNNRTLNSAKSVTISFSDVLMEEALVMLLREAGLSFKIHGEQVVLKRKRDTNGVSEVFETSGLASSSEIRSSDVSNRSSIATLDYMISGKVTSEAGEALPGVNVLVKGTTIGTTTDSDGLYKLSVEDGSKPTLVFSFIGYKTKEIEVTEQTVIDITMEPDVKELGEVVVVGFGTQKKVNVTGSVSSLSGDDLVQRNVPNVQNLLQGKIPGLQVVQSSGKPGDDNALLRIRGIGTFSGAGNNPLVLIDGVLGNLTDLNPDFVESVTVLKDAASAAIYGARAANGVILVTTKKGKSGALNIEYNFNLQVQNATRLPELVTNSADYMKFFNLARERNGLVKQFSDEEIDAYRNATDRVKYPNFDWVDHSFKTAQAKNHNLSVNGGDENTTFNFTVGYLDQNGIVGGYDYNRYNMNLNFDSKIKRVVTVGAKVALIHKDRIQPIHNDSDMILLIYAAGPYYSPFLSDGSGRYTQKYKLGVSANRNPEIITSLDIGRQTHDDNDVATQAYVDVKITKDLTWGVKGAVNLDEHFFKNHETTPGVPTYYFNDNSFAGNLSGFGPNVTDEFTRNFLTTFYSTLNYTKTFAQNHSITVLAGYNQESNNFRVLSGKKRAFPTGDVTELDAGAAAGQSVSGTSNEWAIQSLFGRLTYDYKGKYLFESNLRYDGTSRIAPGNRWGLFPSLSAGWRISEEEFMNNSEWIDDFKIRVSWGQLGNQNIGLYPYQDILSITSYPFSALAQGTVVGRLTDKTLKWETTEMSDIGFDLSLRNKLLFVSADWFKKVTSDILFAAPIPASVGLASPITNFAAMKNTGFEFEIGHQKNINELTYTVNFNLSAFKNEVTKVKAPSFPSRGIIEEGTPLNSYYLTEWIGIFQSEDEIDNGPLHPNNPKPGDLKFKDQNEDGVIDSKDRIIIDGRYPKFFYGGAVNLSWKNFEVNAFFQGEQGRKTYADFWGIDPFVQGAPPTRDLAENQWTPENRSNTHPAMYMVGYTPVSSDGGTLSTYYLHKASYFRLKSLAIGYQVPLKYSRKIGMEMLRLYVSGDNLFTITKYPGADPERITDGRYAIYPQIRIYTLGVRARF